jgi:hypothetical protein
MVNLATALLHAAVDTDEVASGMAGKDGWAMAQVVDTCSSQQRVAVVMTLVMRVTLTWEVLVVTALAVTMLLAMMNL